MLISPQERNAERRPKYVEFLNNTSSAIFAPEGSTSALTHLVESARVQFRRRTWANGWVFQHSRTKTWFFLRRWPSEPPSHTLRLAASEIWGMLVLEAHQAE
mmetsp:Transcript_38863/g.103203  ORF Transcript_38863/g.103203 Transcript_38863/m.103203 type:complete len:102 (-) Transcript_38863:1156-1461(-)